jgi:organic radical activating enzyme
VVCWIDKEFEKYRIWGMPVDSIDAAKGKVIDSAIIAVAAQSMAKEINDTLLHFGIPQDAIIWVGNTRRTIRNTPIETFLINPAIERARTIFYRRGICECSPSANLLLMKIHNMNSEDKSIIVPRLVLQLTNICNMRCKNCNNLIPMINHPCHEPLEEVCSDINKVLAVVDKILTLELLGGEPFSYPWLGDVLECLVSNNKILEIEITTNGTILPKLELVERLSNGKVHVIISDYGNNKQQELEKCFLIHGVHYEVRKNMKWIDSGGIEKRKKTEQEQKDSYRSCTAGMMCKTMYKGKLFQCARAASLYELGAFENGFLDVRSKGLSWQKIREFWLAPDCIACDYCDYSESWREIEAPKFSNLAN